MKRILCFILMVFMCDVSFGASQWTKTEPAGTTNAADIDYWVATINNEAVDRLLSLHRKNCTVLPDTSATLTVDVGEIAIPNSDSSIVRYRKNTAQVAVTWANLAAGDGSDTASTEYYVYAIADADATTFTIKLSTNATAPTDTPTYYRKIGYFYNDASQNIVSVGNFSGGDVKNYVTVSGATNITCTSGTFADITGMTVEYISSGRRAKVVFAAPFEAFGSGTEMELSILCSDMSVQLLYTSSNCQIFQRSTNIYRLQLAPQRDRRRRQDIFLIFHRLCHRPSYALSLELLINLSRLLCQLMSKLRLS
jgi:hypothetical protein